MNDPDLDDAGFVSFDPSMADRAHAELADGEKLLWVGRPRIGRMLLGAIPTFLYGILIGGFILYWGAMAVGSVRVPAPIALLALPMVAVSLLTIGSPFWVAYKASRTCYALTNRRAIVWEPEVVHGLRVRSYLPDDLRRMWRNERGDGSGDLVFEEITTYGRRSGRQVTRRGFLAVEDVRTVEALIRSAFPDVFDAPGRMKFDLESP